MTKLEQLLFAGAAILGLGSLLWLMVRAVRWAKKGTRAGSMLAAVAFPFPDQPPPNEQLRRANSLKRDGESGEPEQ